ncbi:MAG: FtsX-like permease family protein [Gammaproteobacteria bacterium]|nr:FtsX-like permease family protein [Gammaproteobacteria bacterium]
MPVGMLLQLSWRNIWRHRRRNAILLSAIAIAVAGVMLLNTMMRGMQQDLMNTAIENLTGHVKVLDPGYLDDPGIERGFEVADGWQSALPDHVRGWAMRIRVPAVVTSERETRGIQLVGVDPARESISFLGDAAVSGQRLSGPGDSRLLIGGLLAEALDTAAGRRLVLVTQGADGRTREAGFRIAGVYRAEIAGLEKAFVFTGLGALQRLLGTDEITEISIRLDGDEFEAATTAGLAGSFRDQDVMSWRQLEPQAASMVEVSDITIYILFVIVMGALTFGLVNTLVTAVMERLRELGMLRAIGMRPRVVVAQVVVESSAIMAMGVTTGLTMAAGIFALVADGIDLTAFDDSLASFGMRPTFVPVFDFRDVVLVAVLSLILGAISSFYPARRAVKIKPLEALRR